MTTKTIAGALCGLTNDTIVLYDTAREAEEKRIRLLGRWLYCRQCDGEEAQGDILLTEIHRKTQQTCWIMAVGPDCGKLDPNWFRKSKAQKMKMQNVPGLAAKLNVGDIVLIRNPGFSDLVLRSRFDNREFFIHETETLALVRRDKK